MASKKLVLESQLGLLSGSEAATTPSQPCNQLQVLSLDFQLNFWPCVIVMALQMMFIQNLTTVLESVDQAQYNNLFPYITPIFGTFAKPIIGLASDACIRRVPRAVFLIVGTYNFVK